MNVEVRVGIEIAIIVLFVWLIYVPEIVHASLDVSESFFVTFWNVVSFRERDRLASVVFSGLFPVILVSKLLLFTLCSFLNVDFFQFFGHHGSSSKIFLLSVLLVTK